MAASRRFFPSWVVLLFGVLVGATLTTTLTFHLQWCASIAAGEERVVRMPSFPLTVTQRLVNERCLCGEELVALEKKVTINRNPSSDQAPILESRQAAADGDISVVLDSRQLGQRNNFTAKPMASPLHQNEEKPHTMEGLVVGVVSKQGRAQWLESVYDTWGRDAGQLLMFVGDNFNYTHPSARGLPLVRLPGVHTEVNVGGANMLVSALQYLSERYVSTHHWFMLVVDNSYVRVDRLQQLLSQLSPMEILYLGRSAAGKKQQLTKLGLKPHERYCLGTSGIVLSSALLSELKGHFGNCMHGTGLPEDVELGKCISAKLDIQCTQSDKVSMYGGLAFNFPLGRMS